MGVSYNCQIVRELMFEFAPMGLLCINIELALDLHRTSMGGSANMPKMSPLDHFK